VSHNRTFPPRLIKHVHGSIRACLYGPIETKDPVTTVTKLCERVGDTAPNHIGILFAGDGANRQGGVEYLNCRDRISTPKTAVGLYLPREHMAAAVVFDVGYGICLFHPTTRDMVGLYVNPRLGSCVSCEDVSIAIGVKTVVRTSQDPGGVRALVFGFDTLSAYTPEEELVHREMMISLLTFKGVRLEHIEFLDSPPHYRTQPLGTKVLIVHRA
jgi:hypothetical protein